MATLYCAALKPGLQMIVRASVAASDEEWNTALASADTLPKDKPWRTIVINDGGSPSVKQRKALDERLKVTMGGRTAIVTTSTATRAVVSAMTWIARIQVKMFAPQDLHALFSYLDMTTEEIALFDRHMEAASTKLNLTISKMMQH